MMTRATEIAKDKWIAGHQEIEPQKTSAIGVARTKGVTSEKATLMTTTLLRETDDILESEVHAITIAQDQGHKAYFNC